MELSTSNSRSTDVTKNQQTSKNLQITSIHSIKIPLLTKDTPANRQKHPDSPPVESDLTELSWLTNNVHFFKNNQLTISTKPILADRPPARKQNYSSRLSSKNSTRHFKDYNRSLCHRQGHLADDEFLNLSSSSSSSTTSNQSESLPVSPASSTSSSIESGLTNHQISEEKLPVRYAVQLKNNIGTNKPQLTLSCLIFMALQESKDKCLPVREIYEWIEENFPYYRNVVNGGWKSSIRHNLSFSKCFKKMNRTETALHRCTIKKEPFSSLVLNNEVGLNGRKRRAPNATGTCWTVTSECKPYLIQTLKKSCFWFHNSKFYPNLDSLVTEYTSKLQSSADTKTPNSDDDHHNNTNNDKEITPLTKSQKQNSQNSHKKFKSEPSKTNTNGNDSESEEEKQQNLLKFVQMQQEELCKKNQTFSSNSSPDLDLSLSSNSLSSAFSMMSSSWSTSASSDSSKVFSPNELMKNSSTVKPPNNLNSDLEIEVASTLVGMKFCRKV